MTEAEMDALAALHVSRAFFVRIMHPDAPIYLHSGVGRIVLDGQTWLGVADPIGGRLVSIGTIEEPRFGSAAAVTFTLAGVTAAFIRDMWTNRSRLDGVAADVWFVAFDAETQRPLTSRLSLFPRGRITSPKISWQGLGLRTVTLTVESIFSAQNYAPGGRWNSADQKRRYPGDKGLDFMGVKITEVMKQ